LEFTANPKMKQIVAINQGVDGTVYAATPNMAQPI
jgi:hypothetical protein